MRYIYSLIILLFITITACRHQQKQQKTDVIEYILPQTSYFIKINNKEVLNRPAALVVDYYLSQTDKRFLAGSGYALPFGINIFQNNTKIKGFVAVGKTTVLDSLFNGKTYTYEEKTIYETAYNKNKYYAVSLQNLVLISNHKLLLENAIRAESANAGEEQNELLIKGIASFDNNADINWAVHLTKLKPDVFFSSLLKFKPEDIGNWQFFDWVDVDKPVASGLNFSATDTSVLLPLFKDVKAVSCDFGKFIPFAASENVSISFDDFAVFMNGLNQTKLYAPQKISGSYPVLNSLKAIDFFVENNNRAVLLKMENPLDFTGEEAEKIKEINNFDLYQNPYPELINDYFSGIFPETNLKFFAVNGEYLLLTENRTYLEKVLNDIQNHSTLADSKLYQSLRAEIPDDYHMILFKNKIKINGKPYMIARTYQVEHPEIFTNFVLKSYEGESQKDVIIEQMLSYRLPAKPYTDPQLVYNHKSKSYNIIYQDEDDNLIFVNLNGKELWKRKLKDKIIGEIKEVDILRNHKYQYTFVTPHHWYVVDRLGRDVENFPEHFMKKITGGLSVFDYDHNRKYRFGITQGKKFRLFDNQARKVKGFKVKLDEDILYPPEHFRIGNKDFILMQDDKGGLHLLNRRGTTRIKVKRKFNTFRNRWGAYNRKFVNIDDDNTLISIDLAGKIKQGATGLQEDILSQIKEDVLAAVSANKLLLNKELKTLDLGTYERPKIYRYGKHKYIFVADKDNNLIHAFDGKGKTLDKFPIAGKRVLDFRANKTGKYLLVYDSAGNLIVYKF